MAEQATKLAVKTDQKMTAPATAAGPWTPLQNLRREIERVFDDFHLGALRFPFGGRALELALPSAREGAWNLAPAVDVVEKDKEYEITAELPGMDENNIAVKLTNDTLTISVRRRRKPSNVKGALCLGAPLRLVHPVFPGSRWYRHRQDRSNIRQGSVRVTLPKTAEAQKSEEIPVKAA